MDVMSATKRSILIVEDDVMLRTLLVSKFTSEGFDVATAHDGDEGLAKALATKPDIILLDIIMPKKDGATMFEELRKDAAWGKTANVIFFTNLGDASTVARYASDEDTRSHYIMKADYRMDELVRYVQERME
jgi:two-component system, OmpR family, alkaline phosphatase synthesis response regulator PhoP